MEMEHIWTVALILYFGHNFTWAENTKYFVVGKTIELRPPPDTTNITGILWKHGANMAVEWAEGHGVDYYGSFKGRAVLDTTTGCLVIDRATEADVGVYMVEINSKLLEDKYVFASVQEVPKPRVWVKPGAVEEERTLSCDGDVSKAGPVTFWWDITEDRSWVMLDRRITLKKNATLERMERFSCKMVNPAGEKESEPHDNPFFKIRGDLSGLWALVLVPIFAVAVAVAGYVYKDWIKQHVCSEREADRNGAVAVAGADADANAKSTQLVPLTQSSGEND